MTGILFVEQKFKQVLALADVTINGDRPWDIQVHNTKLYERILKEGSFDLGESYIDGWWSCEALDQMIYKITRVALHTKYEAPFKLFRFLQYKLSNMQSKKRSTQVMKQHYDLGNDLFELMLDKNMQYTCAYWKDGDNLDQAQKNKIQLICDKIQLKPGMKILELGGGFGTLARHIASTYKCEVVSYNISTEQVKYARKICEGLPVKIVKADYRDARGLYDRVLAIGLCEHVGYKNYRSLMELAHHSLNDEGIFLLQTIGRNTSLWKPFDPWIQKYVFPHAHLPSIQQLSKAAEGLFVMEDWHSFGPHYDKTLMAWNDNFTKNWSKLNGSYDERFYRIWNFYLLACAGAFRSRDINLWQVVLSKGGIRTGYESIR